MADLQFAEYPINIIIRHFPASPIECRDPTPAAGVTVEPYNTTLVGSVILYQCEQSGFTPSSASSTCETNEMWSPDPSQVVCSIIPPLPTGRVGEHSNCLLFSDCFIATAAYIVPASLLYNVLRKLGYIFTQLD